MLKRCLVIFLFFVSSFNLQANPLVIILLGAPGAGKGTQALYLSEKLSLPQVSTGDLFRENLKKNTSIGKKARSYMDKGELVPDNVVLDMLFTRVDQEDCKQGYILDGFPRTLAQAETLEGHLSAETQTLVFSIEVSDAMILERLGGRLTCEKCGATYHKTALPPKQEGMCDKDQGQLIQRRDDTEEVIKQRLAVYHEQAEPLKDFYQQRGNLVLIDGSVSKEKTKEAIELALQKTVEIKPRAV